MRFLKVFSLYISRLRNVGLMFDRVFMCLWRRVYVCRVSNFVEVIEQLFGVVMPFSV